MLIKPPLQDHPDLLKLRRSIVEKSLWVTVLCCLTIIALLIGAVFYYKLQAENTQNDAFSKIGGRYLASVVSSKMNFSVNPCDDFYSFACGRFEKTTIIPEDAGEINTINMIEGRVLAQLHTLLNSEIQPKEIRPFKMAKQLFRQCMNTTQIEKNGIEYVRRKLNLSKMWPVLSESGKWNESLWNATDFHRFSVDFFIDGDLKNTSRRVLYLTGANLGLSRDMLLKGFQDEIIRSYHNYMVNVSVYLGANRTKAHQDFAKVLIFEMMLANITIPKEERRNSNKLYNPMMLVELIEKYPLIDWLGFINSKMHAGLRFTEDDVVIVQQPAYFDQLQNVLNQTDTETIANYILWRDLADYIPYLTVDLRRMEFEFVKTVTGKSSRPSRWTDCVRIVSGMLNIAVSSMYVREYFSDSRIKTDVSEIIDDVINEFELILYENDWMDAETKNEALKKIRSMHSHVAYPNELFNDSKIENYYKSLQLNETNYLQSAMQIDKLGKTFICARYHEPVNRTDWIDHATSTSVNANYNGKTNSITIIAAMLQGHFYSADRPDYMNYASIGYVIGHEITHGFDDLGRLYDHEGNLVDWWHPETKKSFLVKKKCIIDQYGSYREPSINMTLNGVNTQGENIADNGGLKLAYRAYLTSLRKREQDDPELPGLNYNPQQLFWISAAQTWCSVERPEIKRFMILTDSHAPGKYRVHGTLSNSKEFAKDFQCSLGTPMNPATKCAVW